jgi:predicted nucleic acid-binding Zn ribbon protein
MRCPQCGQPNPEGASFCSQCGSVLPARFRSVMRQSHQTTFQKPFGIVFIVIWNVLSGLGYLLLSAYIGLIGGFLAGVIGAITGSESIGAIVTILSILSFLLGILMISGAVGLWQLAEWGRQLTIWTRVVEILLGCMSLGIGLSEAVRQTGMGSILIISGLFEIIISIVIIAYLVREDVQILFQQEITPMESHQAERHQVFEPPLPQIPQPSPPPASPAQPQSLPANLTVWLEVVQGPHLGQKLFVLKPVSLVGRSSESDIQILEPSVSRKHFRIRFERGQFWLENESAQGTYVNGQPVAQWQPLKDGDYIQAGRVVLQFRMQGRA